MQIGMMKPNARTYVHNVLTKCHDVANYPDTIVHTCGIFVGNENY